MLSVAFSRDGNFVVSGSEDGSARVWEVEKARTYTRLGAKGDSFGSFSWDGKLALTRGSDGTLSAWPVTRKARPTHVPAGQSRRLDVQPGRDTRRARAAERDRDLALERLETRSCARLRERRGEDCKLQV